MKKLELALIVPESVNTMMKICELGGLGERSELPPNGVWGKAPANFEICAMKSSKCMHIYKQIIKQIN